MRLPWPQDARILTPAGDWRKLTRKSASAVDTHAAGPVSACSASRALVWSVPIRRAAVDFREPTPNLTAMTGPE